MNKQILHPNIELPSFLSRSDAALADSLYEQIQMLYKVRRLANDWFGFSPVAKFLEKDDVCSYIYGMIEAQEIIEFEVDDTARGGLIKFNIRTNLASCSGDYHDAPTYTSVIPSLVFNNPTDENLLKWAAEERVRQMNKIRKSKDNALSYFDVIREINYSSRPKVVKKKVSTDKTDLD